MSLGYHTYQAASAASESVEKAIVGIDRDHEYAARSIELALCRFGEIK